MKRICENANICTKALFREEWTGNGINIAENTIIGVSQWLEIVFLTRTDQIKNKKKE